MNSASPTRTYVVLCEKREGTGYIPKKFTLPESRSVNGWDPISGRAKFRVEQIPNTSEEATHYYMAVIDFESVVSSIGAISFEDYSAVKECSAEA